jgi:hypothetical protein
VYEENQPVMVNGVRELTTANAVSTGYRYPGVRQSRLPFRKENEYLIRCPHASGTLKADEVSKHVRYLLDYIDAPTATPVVAFRTGVDFKELPFADFAPGYFQRDGPSFTDL